MEKIPRDRLTAEDRRWVEQLEDWVERLKTLQALVHGGERPGRLVGPIATEASRQFSALKTDLRNEVKRLAPLERRGELQGFAVSDYAPAIQQAAAFLTIKTNAVPSSAWSSELYEAYVTLSYPLSRLEGK